MTKYSDYTAYFEQIAVEFFGHTPTEKHFFRKGLPEFLKGLSTDVNYPALLLDRYDYRYNDNGYDSVTKLRTVAFMVIDNSSDIEDYQRIDEIMTNTEILVDQIINKMRKDKHYPKNEFLQGFDVNSVQVTPIENNADSTFGFFVTADIISVHPTEITND